MRKRTIISIILTVLIIFLTNKYWYSFKPIDVSFNILAKGECSIRVLLNKKNNNDFIKVKDADKKVYLDHENNVTIDIIGSKAPKRIRLILGDFTSDEPIKISNIKLKQGKLKLDDLENFSANTEIKIEDNFLVIPPPKETQKVEITYNKPLNLKADFDFDFKLFIIITVLSFLFIYKISSYAADFSSIKGKSKIDLIFLTIFFCLLFIPMSNIDKSERTLKENRFLNKWKPLITECNEINYNFGKDFDKWFQDRFNLRNFFITTYGYKYLLQKNWQAGNVIKGKEGWLFFNYPDGIESYTNKHHFSQKELKTIASKLNKINDYCEKHNKKFYLFIAPDKHRIYPEYYSDIIRPLRKETRAQQFIDYMNKNSNVKIIYPKQVLLDNKDKLVYYKKDTHWNSLGAYFGYLELMKYINKDFKDIHGYKVKKYMEEEYYGDMYDLLPQSLKREPKDKYSVPNLYDTKNYKCEGRDEDLYIECYNDTLDKNLLVFRDSFSYALMPYLGETFGKVKYYRTRTDIDLEQMPNADIVVLETVERCLKDFNNMKLHTIGE